MPNHSMTPPLYRDRLDQTRLALFENLLAEYAWAYFEARQGSDIEQRFEQAASVGWRAVWKGDPAIREFARVRAKVGTSICYVLGAWLAANPSWDPEHWLDDLSASVFTFSEDGRRLAATGVCFFGLGNSVPPERYRPGYTSFQNEGPLAATVWLERGPPRVTGYTIQFLGRSAPLGGPCRNPSMYRPPMPPDDDWRFVVRRGDPALDTGPASP